jgi:hypothetical protein
VPVRHLRSQLALYGALCGSATGRGRLEKVSYCAVTEHSSVYNIQYWYRSGIGIGGGGGAGPNRTVTARGETQAGTAIIIIKKYKVYDTAPHAALYISPRLSSWTPGVFYTYFYNQARRLRLEKLLYLELSRS